MPYIRHLFLCKLYFGFFQTFKGLKKNYIYIYIYIYTKYDIHIYIIYHILYIAREKIGI